MIFTRAAAVTAAANAITVVAKKEEKIFTPKSTLHNFELYLLSIFTSAKKDKK